MADLDKETAEEAYHAFDDQDANLDAWEAETDDAAETVDEETKEDEDTKEDEKPVETVEPTEESEAEPRDKVEPVVSGDTSKVGLINSKLTREQAKRLTVPDYDDFDDVVDGNGIRPERLAEYTSVIPFWYKSFKDGTEKMGMLPKYPRFLARFGATEASSISMTDVLKEFAPKLHDEFMDADMDSERLAQSAAEIIAKRGLDFTRSLDEDDYAILEKNKVKNPRKYMTVSQVTGISQDVMAVDPGESCVYNSDYAEAMESFCGGSGGDGDVEVVSLDSVIGGLNPKFLKGFLGKDAADIKEVDNDIPEEEPSEPFMPFSSGKSSEPGSIFKAMQRAEKDDGPGKKW